MKKMLLVLAVVTGFSVAGFAQAPGNCELSTVVQADGNASEWPQSWEVSDDKIFSYNVCSDNNNIYIRMKTNDEMVKRKIAHFGLTVWMNADGKKKKKVGLRFPTGVEAKERTDALKATEEERKDMTADQRDKFIKKVNKDMIADLEVLELVGLTDDPLTSTRSGITNGLKVAIAAEDDGTYVYESIIPFKSFRLSKSSISTLAIGFETGKFTPPPLKAANANVPTGGPGGSRGYGGGYGGGGYGGYGGYGAGSSGRGRNLGGSGYRSSPMMTPSVAWTFVKMK